MMVTEFVYTCISGPMGAACVGGAAACTRLGAAIVTQSSRKYEMLPLFEGGEGVI